MLGTEICKVLSAEHELIGLDLVESETNTPLLSAFHEANVTYAARIKAIFDTREPEMVVHAAAWTDVDGCEEEPDRARLVNTTGTANIARAAASKNIPVVFISTDFVFDGEKNTPYKEEDRGNPLNVYGKTKWEAEEIIRKDLPKYVIIRTGWLYGKHGKNFVNTIIEKSKTEKVLKVVNDQIGGPTYAQDVAIGLGRYFKISDFSEQEIYHICDAGKCSWFDLAKEVLANIKGGDVKVEPITANELGRPAPRPKYSVLDNSKFYKRTEYVMRPWDDAIREYIRNECQA